MPEQTEGTFVWVIIIGLVFVIVWCILMKNKCKSTENLSGFGVTSALAAYNRTAYCDPGNDMYGGAYSGGCFLPHRVIF